MHTSSLTHFHCCRLALYVFEKLSRCLAILPRTIHVLPLLRPCSEYFTYSSRIKKHFPINVQLPAQGMLDVRISLARYSLLHFTHTHTLTVSQPMFPPRVNQQFPRCNCAQRPGVHQQRYTSSRYERQPPTISFQIESYPLQRKNPFGMIHDI